MISILQKLELEKLNNKKIILLVLVCLIIFYLDFSFLLNKQLKMLKILQPKIMKLKKDLDTFTKDWQNFQALNNKKIQTEDFIPGTKRIIQEQQLFSFLKDVSNMANKNNVQIAQMKPLKESKQDKTVSAEKFIPILINLDLFCDYHSFGKFINNLENQAIFIAVQNFKITSQSQDYLRQKADLALKTYVTK